MERWISEMIGNESDYGGRNGDRKVDFACNRKKDELEKFYTWQMNSLGPLRFDDDEQKMEFGFFFC